MEMAEFEQAHLPGICLCLKRRIHCLYVFCENICALIEKVFEQVVDINFFYLRSWLGVCGARRGFDI